MTIVLDGTSGITAPSYGGTDTAEYLVPVTSFKNRIINGAMMIDQRNAGASVTITTGNQYTLDRWQSFDTQASKFSVQQNAGSVTPPVGFTKYLGATSLSAYSVAAGDIFAVVQAIEGLNIADLGWGTANAATVTLSFWVRSSLTGTFGGALNNSGASRSYPFTYTISAANTWEQKTVTIAGDTSGTWATDNSVGMYVVLGLGGGSTYSGTAGAWTAGAKYTATGATSVVGTSGATFYITGVQLEKGSTATSFDYRPYGTELALCQRYYVNYFITQYTSFLPFIAVDGSTSMSPLSLPTPLRTSPTVSMTGQFFGNESQASPITSVASATYFGTSTNQLTLFWPAKGAVPYNYPVLRGGPTNAASLFISAEL